MGIHWFLLAAALIVVLQSIIFRFWGQRGLKYERYFSTKACFEGEEAELVERIANRNLVPVPWLRLESLIHAGLKFHSQANLDISDGSIFQNHKSLFSLMPFTQITRRHSLICARRGCYRLNTASLTCGDLLGIYKNTIKLSLDAELLVYPKPAELDSIPLPSHSWQGDISVRRWIVEDPFMMVGAREYRYGDSLKGVNWKATARSGKLQVHQLDYTADHRLLILVNVEDHEKMWSAVNDAALFERGLSYAAAIAGRSIDQGMETGFGTNAYLIDGPKDPVYIEPRSGPNQMTFMLETMARLVVGRSIPIDTMLEDLADHNPVNLDILIISAYVSDKMLKPIEQLRDNGNAVEFLSPDKLTEHPERAGAAL
jgi:uncharacterized protein (DUF58 family)